MNVKELLKKCQRDRTAVLATNFYNFETLTAVMQAAQRMPVSYTHLTLPTKRIV